MVKNARATRSSVQGFMDESLRLSRDFIRRLWVQDFEWCYNHTSKDFVFVGPEHKNLSRDQDELRELLNSVAEKMLRSSVADEVYEPVACDERICCVVGRFLVLTPPDSQKILAQWRRCTFVWRRSGRSAIAEHLHLSAPYGYVEKGESYPIHAGTETYRYMKSLMRLGSSRKSVSLYDVDGTVHWVHPSQIIYLEASRKRTIVHCMTKDIVVPAVIRDAVEMVDNKILRVHRSYAVNRDHVVELKAGMLLLDDGTSIAIPAKRIADVRAELK